MNKEKVLDLAKLSRIKISDEEAESLSREFDAILNYVGEVKKISMSDKRSQTRESFPLRNVMRTDSEGHESGIYTEALLEEAPAREGNYLKVKKIL